jgi:hypothetical protein
LSTPTAPRRESSQRSDGSRLAAERQLAAALERHAEVLASMQELGRPERGQHIAVKAVGRAVHLVSFALAHAAQTGVPLQRLVELTGWTPALVREALTREPDPMRPPATSYVARLAPAGLDPGAVARATAGVEAIARLEALTQRILADVADDAWSPAAADLVDLHERLEAGWRSWRQALGAVDDESAAPGADARPGIDTPGAEELS